MSRTGSVRAPVVSANCSSLTRVRAIHSSVSDRDRDR